MTTYTTSNGRILSLEGLSPREQSYLGKALVAYRAGIPWADFCQITHSPDNPALEAGRATARSFEGPLMNAIVDLECRLGVRQGFLRPSPGRDVDGDPIDRACGTSGADVAAG